MFELAGGRLAGVDAEALFAQQHDDGALPEPHHGLVRNADRQIVEAIAVEVAHRQRIAEVFARQARAAAEDLLCGQAFGAREVENAGRPLQHVNRSGVRERGVVLGNTDDQIVEAVVAEVAARQGPPKGGGLGLARSGDQLVASARPQTAGVAEEYVDRGGRERTEVLAGHRRRDVVEAVGVEVADRERGAETILQAGRIVDPRRVLIEAIRHRREPERRPRAAVDGQDPGLREISHGMIGHADDEIGEGIAVEVAAGEDLAEVHVGFGEPRRGRLPNRDRRRGREPGGRSQVDRDDAGIGEVEGREQAVLVGHPDREVGKAVAVEIAGGEGPAEAVFGLGAAGGELPQDGRRRDPIQPAPTHAVAHHHLAASVDERRRPAAIRNAGREIVDAVAVEIGRCEGKAEGIRTGSVRVRQIRPREPLRPHRREPDRRQRRRLRGPGAGLVHQAGEGRRAGDEGREP